VPFSLPFDGLRACCEPLSLAGTAVLRSYSHSNRALAAAAINGLPQRHLHSAICVPGHPIVTDLIIVIAAMRTCGPQLTRSRPAALYGSLPALSPSKAAAACYDARKSKDMRARNSRRA
jgi:hypothetical protein